ncbi:hypothetical protein KPL70_013597 [Citrus sinensis]|nr:hypothetical protein KPL70_013597 [Citrus sinensis]
MKGFQDLKLSPHFKDMKLPNKPNQNQKAVKFHISDEEDFSDFDDDEYDEYHPPLNKMKKPIMGISGRPGMMPNNMMMMNGNHPQLMNAQNGAPNAAQNAKKDLKLPPHFKDMKLPNMPNRNQNQNQKPVKFSIPDDDEDFSGFDDEYDEPHPPHNKMKPIMGNGGPPGMMPNNMMMMITNGNHPQLMNARNCAPNAAQNAKKGGINNNSNNQPKGGGGDQLPNPQQQQQQQLQQMKCGFDDDESDEPHPPPNKMKPVMGNVGPPRMMPNNMMTMMNGNHPQLMNARKGASNAAQNAKKCGNNNNNNNQPEGGGGGQQPNPQLQLQQMKGFQDLKLPPHFNDMKLPNVLNQNHKAVKFNISDDDEDVSDFDDEFFYDDEYDEHHPPLNEMKPIMGSGGPPRMMPNNMMMNGNRPQLLWHGFGDDDLRLTFSPAPLLAPAACQVNQQYQWQNIKVYQLLGKHKTRSLAVFYLVLEAASFLLDLYGKSERALLLAAFLLSAFGFAMCSNQQSSNSIVTSFTFTNPIKLDRSNYTIWKQQVLSSIRGNGLEGYIDGSRICPGQFLPPEIRSKGSSSSIKGQENPNLVVSSKTSFELWKNLEKQFGYESMAKKVHLKMLLSNLQKGSLTMSEYFTKLRTVIDGLALASSPVNELDLITHLITGLDQSYYPVVVHIEANMLNMDLSEAYAMLLTHEARLENNKLHDSKETKSNYAVNVAQAGNYQKKGRGNWNNNFRGFAGGFKSGFPGSAGFNNSYGRGGFNSRGAGKNFAQGTGVACQICFRFNHTASECRDRFNRNFVPNFPAPAPNHFSNQNQGPRAAFMTTSEGVADQGWFLDSGATHHLTYTVQNLSDSHVIFNESDFPNSKLFSSSVSSSESLSTHPPSFSTQDLEPVSVKAALTNTKWKMAMQNEYDALQNNGTWTLVPAEKATKLVGNKWVFRVKYNPDGSISKYKARLVAKGFHQTYGVDFFETFSPVVKPCTVRIVLSLPEGFINSQFPNHVCKLQKLFMAFNRPPGLDDILITGSSNAQVTEVISKLSSEFALKDLGDFNYFLGVEVTLSAEGLHLSQTKYVGDILRKAHMLGSKGSPTLTAYSDADWGVDPDDRRSVGGYCVYLGSNLVSWSSKKQNTVSRSSAESEYRALALATSEMLWITYLLKELKVSLTKSHVLYYDNKSAEALASNPKYHSRTKHMELDLHFVREHIANKELLIEHVYSSDQLADVLLKPLGSDHFAYMRTKLNVCSRP